MVSGVFQFGCDLFQKVSKSVCRHDDHGTLVLLVPANKTHLSRRSSVCDGSDDSGCGRPRAHIRQTDKKKKTGREN